MSVEKIYFSGKGKPEHQFLSNFHHAPIEWNGKTYATIEHIFQARKARTEQDHEAVRTASTPGEAKKRGRIVKLVDHWDETREQVMIECLRLKFMQHPDLAKKLLDTKDAHLIEETSKWDDGYWGTGRNGRGLNRLGWCLSVVRVELKNRILPAGKQIQR